MALLRSYTPSIGSRSISTWVLWIPPISQDLFLNHNRNHIFLDEMDVNFDIELWLIHLYIYIYITVYDNINKLIRVQTLKTETL